MSTYRVKEIHTSSAHYKNWDKIIGRKVLKLGYDFHTKSLGESRAGWCAGGIAIKGHNESKLFFIFGVKLERC